MPNALNSALTACRQSFWLIACSASLTICCSSLCRFIQCSCTTGFLPRAASTHPHPPYDHRHRRAGGTWPSGCGEEPALVEYRAVLDRRWGRRHTLARIAASQQGWVTELKR